MDIDTSREARRQTDIQTNRHTGRDKEKDAIKTTQIDKPSQIN
jgi:hypothetical protein